MNHSDYFDRIRAKSIDDSVITINQFTQIGFRHFRNSSPTMRVAL